jgi:hypothetical protein
MKKVLSFVLVLSLVLGSFSMAFAATPTDVVGKDCETAVQALSDLGVVSGYTDGTYKPENPVNRAEAAKLIVSALGLEAYAAGITSTSFTDLDGFGWAVGYIGYANQLGLVKGVGNNKFNPAGPVTYEQWATMLVRALGYTDEVLPGTWPANYMIKAQSLGIMKDIKAAGNAAANRGDVAIMLYNNLGQAIGTINKDGEFIENIGRDGVKGTDTMLSRLEKEATPEFGVFTDTALANVADGINLRAYLGANVKLYLNDDDEFIGIKDCNTTFLTGDVNAKGDTFTVGDTDYTIKAAAANAKLFVFQNGEFQTTNASINADFKDTEDITLAVKVSGKTITEAYSVLVWDLNMNASSTADQFEAGDLNTSKNTLFTRAFEEDNNGNIDTTSFELLGVSSLDKIAEDNIVEVYCDSTDKIRRVAVGTTVVEGAVSKINSSSKKFTINGTTYKWDDDVATETGATKPEVTDEGKAFLTYGGKIGYWDETDATADNYAIYMGYDYAEKYSDKTTTIKLFTKEGKEVEYDLKDWNLKTKADNLVTATAVGEIVKYAVNSKNKVDEVTTFAASTLTGYASKSGTRIGGKSVKSSVVVFVYDTDEEEWTLGSMKDITTDSNDNIAAVPYNGGNLADATVMSHVYAVDDKDGKVAALAVTNNAASSDDTYGVIDSTSKRADTDGDKYWAVTGFNDGAELDALTDITLSGSEPNTATTASGLQKIKVNNAGKVTNIANAVAGDLEDWVTANGQGTSIAAGGVEVEKVNKSNNELTLAGKVYGLDAKAVVYKWDTDEEEWTKGTISDIQKTDFVKLYKTDDDFDGFDIVIAWDVDAN